MKFDKMLEKMIKGSFDAILEQVEEGIHIVDLNGITRVYNTSMGEIEGLDADQVIGKHLLEIYPDWQNENSTLLTVLTTEKPIYGLNQKYLNFKGKHITSLNTTLPIYHDHRLIGAIEISRNLTTVSHMSEQIIELQQALYKPTKSIAKESHYTFEEMIGKAKRFLEAKNLAQSASKSTSSVLIYGETGTGKELFAQSIHYGSPRRQKAFIAQNCAAIPETLLEGVLFGTTKGAFTGAVDRPGLFEQAHQGTLFLDEINHMPMSLQTKLLRVLQEKVVRRVGGLKDIPVDVRVISATSEWPEDMILRETMRKDLYYRLNVIFIALPNLNERRSDIPDLAMYFINAFNQSLSKQIVSISEDFMDLLMKRQWQGNVRELQNIIEVAMNNVSPLAYSLDMAPKDMPPELYKKSIEEGGDMSLDPLDKSLPNDYNAHLDAYERQVIKKALEVSDYNVSKAARTMGLSRQNLQYKIQRLGL